MRGSADMVGMPDVRSRLAFFRREIVCQDQPLELEFESTPNFSCSEIRAVRCPFFVMRFAHIYSLTFLSSSSVAVFRGPNSDSRNGVCFATSWHEREIIAPEAPHSHAAFLIVRRDCSSEGERCMKDTDHHIRHLLRHPRIFGRVRRERGCTRRSDQFGRGQNTGLGWRTPLLWTFPCPK